MLLTSTRDSDREMITPLQWGYLLITRCHDQHKGPQDPFAHPPPQNSPTTHHWFIHPTRLTYQQWYFGCPLSLFSLVFYSIYTFRRKEIGRWRLYHRARLRSLSSGTLIKYQRSIHIALIVNGAKNMVRTSSSYSRTTEGNCTQAMSYM